MRNERDKIGRAETEGQRRQDKYGRGTRETGEKQAHAHAHPHTHNHTNKNETPSRQAGGQQRCVFVTSFFPRESNCHTRLFFVGWHPPWPSKTFSCSSCSAKRRGATCQRVAALRQAAFAGTPFPAATPARAEAPSPPAAAKASKRGKDGQIRKDGDKGKRKK